MSKSVYWRVKRFTMYFEVANVDSEIVRVNTSCGEWSPLRSWFPLLYAVLSVAQSFLITNHSLVIIRHIVSAVSKRSMCLSYVCTHGCLSVCVCVCTTCVQLPSGARRGCGPSGGAASALTH